MAKVLPQRELRNNNARVIDAVISGETFIVTRNGQQVAELRPVRSNRQTFVSRADIAALGRGGPHIDRDTFRADLDRVIDQRL